MKTKTLSIIAAVIGIVCATFAVFVYWQDVAVATPIGHPVVRSQHLRQHLRDAAINCYPVPTHDGLIWGTLCAAVVLWAFAGYSFLHRKHG